MYTLQLTLRLPVNNKNKYHFNNQIQYFHGISKISTQKNPNSRQDLSIILYS